jgi:hypothetical protein
MVSLFWKKGIDINLGSPTNIEREGKGPYLRQVIKDMKKKPNQNKDWAFCLSIIGGWNNL